MAPQLRDETVADTSKIAQRLLAHARLCRQIAEVSWREDVAVQFGRLADDCTRAAAAVAAENPAAHAGKVH